MRNKDFLSAVTESFHTFLRTGTSRSTAKLEPLHGAVAQDLAERLGPGYEVWSKGFQKGKEAKVSGRYFDKDVDITALKDGIPVAGISVRFVMQNYMQNSINYFENMLGETANIRCGGCHYFQLFIILDRLPYYATNKKINKKYISKWETFSDHNVEKYVALSNDNKQLCLPRPTRRWCA